MQIGNPCIFAKGNKWYIDYREIFENGTYKKRQLSTKVKVSEKSHSYMLTKYLPAKWAQMQQGLLQQTALCKNFGYFHAEYLAQKQNLISFDKTKKRAGAALEYFGKETDVRTIKKFDIKKYMFYLEQKGYAGDTLRSYFNMLSGILQLVADADLITTNPCRDLKLKFDMTPDEEATRPFLQSECGLMFNMRLSA